MEAEPAYRLEEEVMSEETPVAPLRVGVFVDMPNFNKSMHRAGLRIDTRKLDAAIQRQLIDQLPTRRLMHGIRMPVRKIYYDYHPELVDEGFERFMSHFSNVGYDVIRVAIQKHSPEAVKSSVTIKQFKSLTDSTIVQEITEHVVRDEIDVIVLFTGDSDMHVLLGLAEKYGKRIVYIGDPHRTASMILREAPFVDLRRLDCYFKGERDNIRSQLPLFASCG